MALPLSFPASFSAPDGGHALTVYKEDFVGRDLTNTTPGSSDATDFLGRKVAPGNKDFLGRGLTSEPHAVSTAYAKRAVVYLPSGEELTCVSAGTSAGTPPTPPAIGATVVDGGVTWQRTE